MVLDKLKTWTDLEKYLLRRGKYATSETSKMNRTFTKKEVWNMYLDQCKKYKPSDLPIRTRKLLLKHVRKDFGMGMTNIDAMEKYAEQIINKMLADRLSYAEMVKVISIIDARFNNVRKVTKER